LSVRQSIRRIDKPKPARSWPERVVVTDDGRGRTRGRDEDVAEVGTTRSTVNYSAPEAMGMLPPEIEELKQLVRSVVQRECIPLESTFLSHRPGDERDQTEVGRRLLGAIPRLRVAAACDDSHRKR